MAVPVTVVVSLAASLPLTEPVAVVKAAPASAPLVSEPCR